MSEEPIQQREFLEAVAKIGRAPQAGRAVRSEGRRAETTRRLLTFQLASEEYALDILRIREIARLRPITEVPRTVPCLAGILSLRGAVLPLVDLRLRLRLAAQPLGKMARVLVVSRDGEPVGLLVDRVSQVVRLHADEIEPPPSFGAGDSAMIAGIGRPAGGKRLVLLLDLAAVLAFDAAARREDAR